MSQGDAYLEGTRDAFGDAYAFLMGAIAGTEDTQARIALLKAAQFVNGQRKALDKRPMPMTRDEFKSMLGEGFHTAFRKATDDSHAAEAWRQIREMAPGAWGSVLEFVTYGFETTYKLEWKETE